MYPSTDSTHATQAAGPSAASNDDVRAAIAAMAASSPNEEEEEEVIDDAQLFEPVTREEAENCVFSSWYPRFSSVTFKSEIIRPLSKEFVDYLLADGVYVPNQAPIEYGGELETVGPDDASDWSGYDDDDEEEEEPHIPGLADASAEISKRIEKLGGSVLPRMGWSAPTDAVWITTTNTLKCKTPADIYWLLKSSDKISKDLSEGRHGAEPRELVLRQWANLVPSMMFRCFVKQHELVGISQVDFQHHAFLDEMGEEVVRKLTDFFAAHISEFPSENYCFDAYVARSVDRVYVVDFEPWTHTTDSCLFEWKELAAAQSSHFLGLRLFPEGVNPLGHFSAKYSSNCFPIELTADAYHNSLAKLIQQAKAETEQAKTEAK
ncbi:hypothetical protein GGF46_000692 [Coemansia sp. RSA 552]|nr:hypothetical protein GGF46_000692 [Coemansia sp. RSA 552]